MLGQSAARPSCVCSWRGTILRLLYFAVDELYLQADTISECLLYYVLVCWIYYCVYKEWNILL